MMIRSIYGKTLYQKRYMTLGWFLGIMAITVLTMSVYNSFSGGEIGASLQSLPPALQKIAGDVSSFKTVGGYISQQIFALRLPLLLIILSIAVLVSVTAGEEQQGLTETQLSLPVSRGRLLMQKFAAGLTVIMAASLGALAGIKVGLLLVGQTYSLPDVLPYLLNCVLLALCYGLVGFTVAAVTGRRGLALGIASGLAFLSYLINSLALSVDSLGLLDKFTLFHYYQTTGDYDWAKSGVLAVTAVALIAVSLYAFKRRDIRAR